MLKNQLRDITNKKWEDFFRIFQADWPFLFYFETTKQAVVLFSFAHSDSGRPERSTSFVVNTNLARTIGLSILSRLFIQCTRCPASCVTREHSLLVLPLIISVEWEAVIVLIAFDSNEVGHQSLLAIHQDSRHGCHDWDDDDEEDSDPESSVGPSLTIDANTII